MDDAPAQGKDGRLLPGATREGELMDTMNQESERLLREYEARERERQYTAELNRHEEEIDEPKSFVGLIDHLFRSPKRDPRRRARA